MSSAITISEKNTPNIMRKKELEIMNDKKLYHNNPEYREKVKQQALSRYYKLKEAKVHLSRYERTKRI